MKTCRLHQSDVKKVQGWRANNELHQASNKTKRNKLSDLIQSVKMSNQMSTKAVYSVRKNVKEMIAAKNKQEEVTR